MLLDNRHAGRPVEAEGRREVGKGDKSLLVPGLREPGVVERCADGEAWLVAIGRGGCTWGGVGWTGRYWRYRRGRTDVKRTGLLQPSDGCCRPGSGPGRPDCAAGRTRSWHQPSR